jgi:hypothetical protein
MISRSTHRVQRVSRAGVVHVEARRARDEAVVALVVDAAEAEHRPEVVALRRVVVDDVEDHLDAGAVQRLHHPLELAHLVARRRVERVRREVADRRVAPVVRQPAAGEEALVDDVVHRQQLDRRHAERLEIRDRVLAGETAVGPAQILAHTGPKLREALDVELVDDRLLPRRPRPDDLIVLPLERRVDHDRLRHRRRRVGRVDGEVSVLRAGAGHVRERARRTPVDGAVDRLRVRVDQQLRGIEAVPRQRLVRAVHAIAVALPRPDARQVAVPVERGPFVQLDALFPVVAVEQAQLDALGVLREEREVRAGAIPLGAERERVARPDSAIRHLRDGSGEAGVVRSAGDDQHVLAWLGQLMTWEDRHRRLMRRLAIVLVLTALVDIFGTIAEYALEKGVAHGDIHSFGDALFFTTVQLLTVSSQIRNPLTPWGRVVDVVLELWAVIVVAGSAGAIASFFQTADR